MSFQKDQTVFDKSCHFNSKTKKMLKRKLKVLKKTPTHSRISELALFLREKTGNYNIDLFSRGTSIVYICDVVESIIENPGKYTSIIESENSNLFPIVKKSLKQLLEENLSENLCQRIELNTNNLIKNKQLEEEEEEELLVENVDIEIEDEDENEEDEGYSLYKEESDEEEAEFSD